GAGARRAGDAVAGADLGDGVAVAEHAAARDDEEDLVLAQVSVERTGAAPWRHPGEVGAEAPRHGIQGRRERLVVLAPVVAGEAGDFLDVVDVDDAGWRFAHRRECMSRSAQRPRRQPEDGREWPRSRKTG